MKRNRLISHSIDAMVELPEMAVELPEIAKLPGKDEAVRQLAGHHRQFNVERMTRLELATSTLGRSRSTN